MDWKKEQLRQKNKEIIQRKIIAVEKTLATILRTEKDPDIKKRAINSLYDYKNKLFEQLNLT